MGLKAKASPEWHHPSQLKAIINKVSDIHQYMISQLYPLTGTFVSIQTDRNLFAVLVYLVQQQIRLEYAPTFHSGLTAQVGGHSPQIP